MNNRNGERLIRICGCYLRSFFCSKMCSIIEPAMTAFLCFLVAAGSIIVKTGGVPKNLNPGKKRFDVFHVEMDRTGKKFEEGNL